MKWRKFRPIKWDPQSAEGFLARVFLPVRVSVSRYELANAMPPFPWPFMCDAAMRKWIRIRLEERGMDTSKEVVQFDDEKSAHVVFLGYPRSDQTRKEDQWNGRSA